MSKSYKYLLLVIGIIFVALVIFALNPKSTQTENSSPKTATPQTETNKNLKTNKFDEVGLTFSSPSDLLVSGEKADKNTFTLYVQRGKYPDNDYYQLYGVYNLAASQVNKEDLKKELEAGSTSDSIVGGYPAVSGQIKGDRNRFVTYIITNRGLFTLATSQPTESNRQLTESILKTFQLN